MQKNEKIIVLVVEDSEGLLALLKYYFGRQPEKYEAHYASSIIATSDQLSRLDAVDVILLDREIVGGITDSFIAQIKEKFPNCRIIATSGDNVDKQMVLGAHHALAKPFQVCELEGALAQPVTVIA